MPCYVIRIRLLVAETLVSGRLFVPRATKHDNRSYRRRFWLIKQPSGKHVRCVCFSLCSWLYFPVYLISNLAHRRLVLLSTEKISTALVYTLGKLSSAFYKQPDSVCDTLLQSKNTGNSPLSIVLPELSVILESPASAWPW